MGRKMATVNPPEHEFNKKEDKMHFTWSSAEWQHSALSNSTSKDFAKLFQVPYHTVAVQVVGMFSSHSSGGKPYK